MQNLSDFAIVVCYSKASLVVIIVTCSYYLLQEREGDYIAPPVTLHGGRKEGSRDLK